MAITLIDGTLNISRTIIVFGLLFIGIIIQNYFFGIDKDKDKSSNK